MDPQGRKWLAIVRLCGTGQSAEDRAGAGRGFRPRHRAYRCAARAGRKRNPHRLHRGHERRRADRRDVRQWHFARGNGAAGIRYPLSRFRALDAFANGHGVQRTPRTLSAQVHARGNICRDENSTEHRGYRSDERKVRALHRGRDRAGTARVMRLSRVIFAGGISRTDPGGWISHRDCARRSRAGNGIRHCNRRAPRAGPAWFGAAKYDRGDQPFVFDHSDRRGAALAYRRGYSDRARGSSHPVGRIREDAAAGGRR